MRVKGVVWQYYGVEFPNLCPTWYLRDMLWQCICELAKLFPTRLLGGLLWQHCGQKSLTLASWKQTQAILRPWVCPELPNPLFQDHTLARESLNITRSFPTSHLGGMIWQYYASGVANNVPPWHLRRILWQYYGLRSAKKCPT